MFQILEDSFPAGERRTEEGQKKLLSLDEYSLLGLKEDGSIVGFVAEWEGPKHRFVEHFAINEKFRGGGIGSRLLNEYHDLNDKPVILEVEPPEDDTQKRRIKFYERNGYHLTEYGYVQPKINTGIEGVPLVLMSYPDKLTEDGFLLFKNWAFSTVYNQGKND